MNRYDLALGKKPLVYPNESHTIEDIEKAVAKRCMIMDVSDTHLTFRKYLYTPGRQRMVATYSESINIALLMPIDEMLSTIEEQLDYKLQLLSVSKATPNPETPPAWIGAVTGSFGPGVIYDPYLTRTVETSGLSGALTPVGERCRLAEQRMSAEIELRAGQFRDAPRL